jgi:hypothetical protein
MKKLSSKIIIFLLVTTFLWGGVNFNFEKSETAHVLEISSAQAQTTPASTSDSKAKPWRISTIITKVADIAGGIVGVFTWYGPVAAVLLAIGSICNFIVGIQALIFDSLLWISMTNFGPIIDSSGIATAWTIIRNLINVSFIFIILYIAISIILGDFSPKKKSTVAGVVISALLINYSMFITRVLIDFGNIIATAIYNTPSGAFSTGGVMQALQLQTILTPDNLLATGQINSIVLMLLQIVMVCTFMAVLFRGTLFMLGRLVALLILLALSPIGFVGFGIPWLKDKADEWWATLMGQVFLLPVFLFFLMMTNIMLKAAGNIIGIFNFTTLNVLNWSTHVQSGSSMADGSSFTAFQPGQWVYFGLIIGMLHASTKMTKKLAGKTMSDLVDKAAKGMKFAAAAVIAVGASVATGGAAAPAAAARLAGIAAKGGTMAKVAKGGLSLMSKGASAAKVFGKPGLVGDLSRNLLGSTIGSIKDSTGLDLKGATKDVNDYQKNYEKFATAEANKIGPGAAIAERTNREQTMADIESRAEERIGEDPEREKLAKISEDAAKETKKLSDEIAKLDKDIAAAPNQGTKAALYAQQQEKVAQRTQFTKEGTSANETLQANKEERDEKKKALIRQIAAESGYSMEEHEKRMGVIDANGKLQGGEIEREIIQKRGAQDQYLKNLSEKGLAGKKTAAMLRVAVAKGIVKQKSKREEYLDEMEATAKKEAEEKAKADAKKTT